MKKLHDSGIRSQYNIVNIKVQYNQNHVWLTLLHYSTPHTTPHHTTSHHITSHHTTPHHTTSHHTTPHHTTPHHTTSHHTTLHHTAGKIRGDIQSYEVHVTAYRDDLRNAPYYLYGTGPVRATELLTNADKMHNQQKGILII